MKHTHADNYQCLIITLSPSLTRSFELPEGQYAPCSHSYTHILCPSLSKYKPELDGSRPRPGHARDCCILDSAEELLQKIYSHKRYQHKVLVVDTTLAQLTNTANIQWSILVPRFHLLLTQ